MSRDEVVAKAAEAMRGKGLIRLLDETRINLVSALYDAGLLATPEMRECAEACVDYSKTAPLGYDVAARMRLAGRAYAASVRKPERYEADDGIVVDTAEFRRAMAAFYGLDRARHAREWAAKLNAEDRP